MYIMYVDESGDTGRFGAGSSTRYFALTGLTVHESRWRELLDSLVSYRRAMKATYGLPMRTEIHASEYIRRPPYPGIAKHQRLAIMRNLLDELAKVPDLSITNVIVDKRGKGPQYNVFDQAWKTLFQRFENTIKYGNFPGGHQTDKGMVLVDNTEGRKLQSLLRKMGVYNPIPNMAMIGQGSRNIPTLRIIEDPHHKNSVDSYFVQACDVCAYFLHQKYAPNAYIRTTGARNYFERLLPVLNRRASITDALGIVNL